MSSTVSMHLRDLMVSLAFRNDVTPVPPATLWLGLTYDVAPSNAPGSLLSEPLIGSYAREAYSMGSAHWLSSGFGEVVNADLVTFPMATADWGEVRGWALVDSAILGAGLTWASGSLVTPTYVEAGRTIAIPPRSISIGLYD